MAADIQKPPRNRRPFFHRVFTLQFTRKCILTAFAAVALSLSVFFLLRFFPEKAFELSSPYFGTIKASALSASNYLSEIESVRIRVEKQRDTIDAAFATAVSAQKAASNATAQVAHAWEQLRLIETNAVFLQVVAQAYSDSRSAFDQLKVWAVNDKHPFQRESSSAVVSLTDSHNHTDSNPMGLGLIEYHPVPEVAKDPKLPPEKLKELLRNEPYYLLRISIIQHMVKRVDFSKHDKLELLMEIMETDNNLRTVSYAGFTFRELSGWNYKTLALDGFQEWWKKNKDELKKQPK